MMKHLFLALLFITGVVGCNEKVTYSLVTSNNSDELVDEVQVWFDEKPVNNGILSPGDHVTIASSNFKLKKQMKITWVDSNNDSHEQSFKTFDYIPEDYDEGNVIFVYEGNGRFILKFHKPTNNFPTLTD